MAGGGDYVFPMAIESHFHTTTTSPTRQSVAHQPTEMSTAQAQEQPEAAHTIHNAATPDARAEVSSEAIPVDRRTGGILCISQPHRDASEDLVSESSRQGEALTGSGNRETQDGRQTDVVASDVGTSISARVVRCGWPRAWTVVRTGTVAAGAVRHVSALAGIARYCLPAPLRHVSLTWWSRHFQTMRRKNGKRKMPFNRVTVNPLKRRDR